MAMFNFPLEELLNGTLFPLKIPFGEHTITLQLPVPAPAPVPVDLTKPHYRPGYGTFLPLPSATEILDFVETDTILSNLPEDQFRQKIIETALPMDNLGLNRSKGESRAQAYLDMVTWDDAYRKSWENDNSVNSSSCGMFVRNIWWLCGARGADLFDNKYSGGVLTKLINFDTTARKRWGTEFNAKTFFPKVGDTLYLYNASTNSQHIFIICGIDKKIVFENGESTVYNEDGSLASVITFTSVDGGQEDGHGPDGKGTSKTWGCQAIKRCERQMKLNNGKFLNVGTSWPFPNGTTGRGINTWIDIWAAKSRFTGKYVSPIREGVVADPMPSVMESTTAQSSFMTSRGEGDSAGTTTDDFYTWPTLPDPLPDTIITRIKTNRDALLTKLIKFNNQTKIVNNVSVKSGYSYNGKSLKPAKLLEESHKSIWPKDWPRDSATEERVKVVLERFWTESQNEGRASAVMTGDKAHFTWGSGLAYTGPSFKQSLLKYFQANESARKGFLDYGITLTDSNVFMIVDTDNTTILRDDAAAMYIDGRDAEGEYPIRQVLLTAFVTVTEKYLAEPSKMQFESLLQKFFYKFNGKETFNHHILMNWRPEAICYVVHCSMWGSFTKVGEWKAFANTNGDLKNILRTEVLGTKFYSDKGTYKLVPKKMDAFFPSSTMIGGMGDKILIKENHVIPLESLDQAEKGDIVFEMDPNISKHKYLVLKGVNIPDWITVNDPATDEPPASLKDPNPIDTKDQINDFIAAKQGLPMSDLISVFLNIRTARSYAKLQEMRDWYSNRANPKFEAWGIRPRIAMDAVLHKSEGSSAGWILADCERINITATSCVDQYTAVKTTIGIA